jgi:hypothetical protein
VSARFGRNQRRKLLERIDELEQDVHIGRVMENGLRLTLADERAKLAQVLRDQLGKGVIPLEVEHFINPEQRTVIMRAIFDERRANLHYQHAVSPHDLRIQRDREERERFGLYLGRAIADRIADAYAGQQQSSSRRAA